MKVPEQDIQNSLNKFDELLLLENDVFKSTVTEALDEFRFCWLWNSVILDSFPYGDTSPTPDFTYMNGQVAKFYWLSLLSILRGQTIQFVHMFRQFSENAKYATFAITWPRDPRLKSIGEQSQKAKMFSELEEKYPNEVSELQEITKKFQSFTHASIKHTALNKIYDDVTERHGITFIDHLPQSDVKRLLIILGVYGAKYVAMIQKSPNKAVIKYNEYTVRLINEYLTPQTNNYIDEFLFRK